MSGDFHQPLQRRDSDRLLARVKAARFCKHVVSRNRATQARICVVCAAQPPSTHLLENTSSPILLEKDVVDPAHLQLAAGFSDCDCWTVFDDWKRDHGQHQSCGTYARDHGRRVDADRKRFPSATSCLRPCRARLSLPSRPSMPPFRPRTSPYWSRRLLPPVS
jgi:hypothetical protein